jgi:hypothetical protein
MLEDAAGSGSLITEDASLEPWFPLANHRFFYGTMRSGSMEDDALHVQLHVRNGKFATQHDADPGCRSARLHANQVLKLAANDLEQRKLLATTLSKPGAKVKAFVHQGAGSHRLRRPTGMKWPQSTRVTAPAWAVSRAAAILPT